MKEVIMIKVLDMQRFESNRTLLFCDMFDDTEITSRILVSGKVYTDFSVCENRQCFSIPTTRIIVISGFDEKEKPEFVEFVTLDF